MTTERAPEDITIAFLGIFGSDSSKDLRGAVMVTNGRGFPLEFRVSTPVRPTAVQTALYGKSLEPYVATELLGSRLVSEIKHKYDVVLTNRLTSIDTDASAPVGFAAHAGSYVHEERLIALIGLLSRRQVPVNRWPW